MGTQIIGRWIIMQEEKCGMMERRERWRDEAIMNREKGAMERKGWKEWWMNGEKGRMERCNGWREGVMDG